MNTIYAVMEMSGNFSHTIEEFDNRDSASEYVMDIAMDDAKETFREGTHFEEIEEEFEEALELALSYYSIEEWEVV